VNVETLLTDKNIYFLPKGGDFLVSCLNPEHADKNPSMRIDQITGIFNCFSCGFKGNLFNYFGERANQLQQRRELFKKKLIQKRSESVGLSFPQNRLPFIGSWRNIKPETYKKFEAFQHPNPDYVGRIVFPIRDISGKIVAFQGRHTAEGTPKYKFTPPGARLPFFPVVEFIKGSVILVEGIFDMINLHDKGLTNAVCCFGTNNYNETKLSMLRVQGAEYVEVFFDGDDPGQQAAEKLVSECEKVGLVARNVHLKETDPGALTQTSVEKLRKKLYG
jgi:DNA primase|tara:strand:+ start:8596 stop:9423 length:828 start_codon:yes stop_codon:yes gene_type:complete